MMEIPNTLIDVYGSRLGPYGIALYCCLASQADAQGHAQPSIPWMAQTLGISTRQILRALPELVAVGLLTIQKVKQHNLYCLTPYHDSQSVVTHSQRLTVNSDSQSVLDPQEIQAEICSQGSPGPDLQGSLDPHTSQIPTLKTNPPPPFGGTARARTRQYARRIVPTAMDGFNRWWASYTPSRCFEKDWCLQRWIREGLEDRAEEIMAHTRAMQQTTQWQDEEKIPHARTYLTQQRYTAPIPRGAVTPRRRSYTPEEIDRAFAEHDAWRARR